MTDKERTRHSKSSDERKSSKGSDYFEIGGSDINSSIYFFRFLATLPANRLTGSMTALEKAGAIEIERAILAGSKT